MITVVAFLASSVAFLGGFMHGCKIISTGVRRLRAGRGQHA